MTTRKPSDSPVGWLKEKLGWLTADRGVEARGKLERLDAASDEAGSGARRSCPRR